MGAFEQKSEEDISAKNTKGGGYGKHLSEAHHDFDKCSHTIPIVRWLQRAMM